MSRLSRYWLSQPLLFGVLLAALVLRGLIPAGFMPSSGGTRFALEICTVGFPASALPDAGIPHDGRSDHGQDHGSSPHSGSDTCPFGSAPAAAPAPDLAAVPALFVSGQQPETRLPPTFASSQRYRVQQPRGPPVLI